MKLNGKMMVAVVMMVGSLAAGGCSTASAQDSGPVAPEETAATAPVDNGSTSSATNGVEQDARGFHFYAPFAPPAARFEVRGVAPSARHFWAPGYYRWNGREHVWVGGRWELRRGGFEYAGPRWVNRFGRSEYIPGRAYFAVPASMDVKVVLAKLKEANLPLNFEVVHPVDDDQGPE